MENCGCNIQQDDDFKSYQDTCPIYNNAPNIAEKATDHVVEDNAPIFNRLDHSDQHNEANACVNYTFELILDSDFDPDDFWEQNSDSQDEDDEELEFNSDL